MSDPLHLALAISLIVLAALVVRIGVDENFRVRSFYDERGRRDNFIMSAATYAFEGLHQLAVPFALHHWVHLALVVCTTILASFTSIQILWRVKLSQRAERHHNA